MVVAEVAGREPLPAFVTHSWSNMVLRVIQRDETGLVQALREGRRDAPTALWHRFGQRIHRLVLRTIGPDVAVEELVQREQAAQQQMPAAPATPEATPEETKKK